MVPGLLHEVHRGSHRVRDRISLVVAERRVVRKKGDRVAGLESLMQLFLGKSGLLILYFEQSGNFVFAGHPQRFSLYRLRCSVWNMPVAPARWGGVLRGARHIQCGSIPESSSPLRWFEGSVSLLFQPSGDYPKNDPP